MLNVRRVIFWQAAAVVGAIALAVTLSRFFPVVSFVEALQEACDELGRLGRRFAIRCFLRLVIFFYCREASSLWEAVSSSGYGGDF